MKLLITGLGGTLAPALADAARAAGHEVLGWDRQAVNPDDEAASARWLDAQAPDAVAHLAMGSARWAAWLAARSPRFLFTSTAMVFDHDPDGPHDVAAARTARDDYGRYKIACEDAVQAAQPQAVLARIGWQIDLYRRGNNMRCALDAQQANSGGVDASRVWTPACSFMDDTAAALLALLEAPQPGVHHLDSNAEEAWTFDAVARGLAQAAGCEWAVRVNDDYRHDQRLVGGPTQLPPLSRRLPALKRTD
ncbi:sugar nucleotide-binding protein [Roseateles sp. BYS87W]|uniref:Sugar nucleotide-binding protein n=1 Tax=Pelomonas baiyunensis TaxID=3299026 RepID=A0ABW7GYF2_9BURK